MDLLRMVQSARTAKTLKRLARDVAKRCYCSLEAHIGRRAKEMSLHEAKGYIRARAARHVHRETDIALSRDTGLYLWQRGEIILLATEELITQVIDGRAASWEKPSVELKAG